VKSVPLRLHSLNSLMPPINLQEIPRTVLTVASLWKLLAVSLTLTGPLSLVVGLWLWHLLGDIVNGENAESISIEGFGFTALPIVFLITFGALSLVLAPIAFRASFHLRRMRRRGILYSNLITASLLLLIIPTLPLVVMLSVVFLGILSSSPVTSFTNILAFAIILIDVVVAFLLALSGFSLISLNRKAIRSRFSQ
jgi:hypothetical protein